MFEIITLFSRAFFSVAIKILGFSKTLERLHRSRKGTLETRNSLSVDRKNCRCLEFGLERVPYIA